MTDHNIIRTLEPYMLHADNINSLQTVHFFPQQKKVENEKTHYIKKNNEESLTTDGIFIPKQQDKLFWCFYIFMHGLKEYKYVSHSFEIEKKFKISSAEKLRECKCILKQHKLKYSDIESELVNDKKITIKGLHALCLLHKVSITYIAGFVYYILGYSNENAEYKNCVIIANNKNNSPESIKHASSNVDVGIQVDATNEDVKLLCEKNIHIKNYNKVMLSISSYTMSMLSEMAHTLNIDQYTDVGKRKLKKQLYQEISEKIC